MSESQCAFTATAKTETKAVRTVTLTLSKEVDDYLRSKPCDRFFYEGVSIETACRITRVIETVNGPLLQLSQAMPIVLADCVLA